MTPARSCTTAKSTAIKLAQLKPWAICHSGGSASYDTYDVLQHEVYRSVVREYDAAQIGFCGGHQVAASFFGATLGHMRKLREKDPDHNPGYYTGYYKEGDLPDSNRS